MLHSSQVAYLLLPLLGIAACYGIVLRYDLLCWSKRPIDGNLTYRGRRLFGEHKTWRGALCALVGGIFVVAVQKYLIADGAARVALLDYRHANLFCLGSAFGAGSMLGELPNSFLKRQIGVPPGSAPRGWGSVFCFVFDQVDLVPSTWALLLFWVRPTPTQVVCSLVIVFLVHQLVSYVGFYIGARTAIR
jgi:CDP-2,3-bis-(O-geranylgeranyl)-sn-glycerol synthase